MNVTEAADGVKVYNLSVGKTLPEWLSEKKKTALRYDEDYRKRIEVVQDLEFPAASQRLKLSPDGQFLVATGTYRPQVRIYELSQLSMKCQRNMDCEAAQFQIIGEGDYSKIAFLQRDRTIEFHVKYGSYHKTRIPKFGRDMMYNSRDCGLYTVGSGSEVYILDLEGGKFETPWNTSLTEINKCGMNPVHNLMGFAGTNSCVEFWDPRAKSRCSLLKLKSALGASEDFEVTSLRFHDTDGLTLALGTEHGQVLIYDLRSAHPMIIKDHQYECPIVDLKFHSVNDKNLVLSADSKLLKIWEYGTPEGKTFTNIEPQADINDICLFKKNGNDHDGCRTSSYSGVLCACLGSRSLLDLLLG
eukprot:TRINITY_DN12941_c0_g1_i1.p1 TRINITY_DN12941_c0_g1~~TRINITY_DN12941_c0_g1_i1.p1  ORF type:complete len:394 (-),score=98.28 TRINITY_DN12941_c0_g1_i1:267-1340(-)